MYRTMTEIEADIRTRYDIETFTARHPQAQIFRWVNDAYRDLRDKLTSDGSQLFIALQEAPSTTTGKTLGYPGTLLTGGSFDGFTSVLEVHVKIGSSWMPLREISLADALTNTDDSSTGRPWAWCLAGLTRETSATDGYQGQRILIVPPLDALYTFRIVGVLTFVDLAASDRLMTDLGLQEYCIRYAGVLLANRDDDVQLWQARKAELQEAYQDILKRSKNRTPGRTSRVDTRTRGRCYVR